MEILDFFNNLNEQLNTFLLNAGAWAPFMSSIFVVLEGTLAFLPLFVFITINIISTGPIVGSLLSWICTIAGSFLAFFLCRVGLSPLFQRFLNNTKHLNKFMHMIDHMSFSKLVLIISIPLTPSFFVNLAAGLSKIPKKKYLYALLLGKTCIVLFWGVLGTSLVDCLTNPIKLIKVVIMIVGCNLIGKFINKKFNIDEIFDKK